MTSQLKRPTIHCVFIVVVVDFLPRLLLKTVCRVWTRPSFLYRRISLIEGTTFPYLPTIYSSHKYVQMTCVCTWSRLTSKPFLRVSFALRVSLSLNYMIIVFASIGSITKKGPFIFFLICRPLSLFLLKNHWMRCTGESNMNRVGKILLSWCLDTFPKNLSNSVDPISRLRFHPQTSFPLLWPLRRRKSVDIRSSTPYCGN